MFYLKFIYIDLTLFTFFRLFYSYYSNASQYVSRTLSPSRNAPAESHSSAHKEAGLGEHKHRTRSRSFDEAESGSRRIGWGRLVGPLLAFALIEAAPAPSPNLEDIERPRVCHIHRRVCDREFPLCPLTGAAVLPDSPWHHPVASTIPWVRNTLEFSLLQTVTAHILNLETVIFCTCSCLR